MPEACGQCWLGWPYEPCGPGYRPPAVAGGGGMRPASNDKGPGRKDGPTDRHRQAASEGQCVNCLCLACIGMLLAVFVCVLRQVTCPASKQANKPRNEEELADPGCPCASARAAAARSAHYLVYGT